MRADKGYMFIPNRGIIVQLLSLRSKGHALAPPPTQSEQGGSWQAYYMAWSLKLHAYKFEPFLTI